MQQTPEMRSSDRHFRLTEMANILTDLLLQYPTDQIGVVFVCTHNSRRSQFAQVWGQVMARWNGVTRVDFYSGGTQVTRVHPSVVLALESEGMEVFRQEGPSEENPVYTIRFGLEGDDIVCVSKLCEPSALPDKPFVAVMTCGEADYSCPPILDAAARIVLPYEDPKVSDGLVNEREFYRVSSRIIAAEMMAIFQMVQASLKHPS